MGKIKYAFAVISTLLLTGVTRAQVPTFTPNDPSYDAVSAQMMHVPEGYAVLQQFEKKGQRFADQATIIVIDGWISTRHPELKDNHLSQYDIDFTGESTWENDCDHGNAVGSRIAAATNNNMGIASLNLTGRLKVVSFKIVDGKCNVTGNSDLALQQAIVLNQQHPELHIVAVNMSFHRDNAGVDPNSIEGAAYRTLAKAGIVMFASIGDTANPHNVDIAKDVTPAAYALYPEYNVVGVGGLDGSGQGLLSKSNYGPQTTAFAAPGYAQLGTYGKGIDPPFSDPNVVSTGSGVSAAVPQVAAAYALLRLYVEPDPNLSLGILKATAVLPAGLKGKIGYGIPNLYAALTYQYPQPILSLMSDQNQGGTRGAVLSSVTHTSESFSIKDPFNFSIDGYRRLMLFATNLGLLPGENWTNVTATATKVGFPASTVSLPVEYAGPLADSPPELSQINVRLTDAVAGWGDTELRVTVHRQVSKPIVVRIQ
jgi:hypothetical protein